MLHTWPLSLKHNTFHVVSMDTFWAFDPNSGVLCVRVRVRAQWAVVGDTFPVGCRFQNSIVFRDNSFTHNPDERNPLYKSVLLIYDNNNTFNVVLVTSSWRNVRLIFVSQALNTGSTNQTVASRTSPCRGATMVRDAFRITHVKL